MRLNFCVKTSRGVFKYLGKKLGGFWGVAYLSRKEVHLDEQLLHRSKQLQLEVIIHESLHLLYPKWSEKQVDKTAQNLAMIIKKSKLI